MLESLTLFLNMVDFQATHSLYLTMLELNMLEEEQSFLIKILVHFGDLSPPKFCYIYLAFQRAFTLLPMFCIVLL